MRRGCWTILFVLALSWVAHSHERWLTFPTAHLLVAYRSDLADRYLAGLQTPDAVLERVRDEVVRLEADFVAVERLLRVDYDAARLGRVPVALYPSLEAYQEAASCLICAAHVGRPLWPLGEDELTLSFGPHLNAESRRGTVWHEFTHVLDFAVLAGGGTPTWYEGLAAYVANRLAGEAGTRVRAVLREVLKRYRLSHPLTLADYVVRRGYGRWTYNLGENLIDLLVRRGGWERFLAFYRELDRPELEELDAQVRAHYGLSLEELEAIWEAELAAAPLTATGEAAYRFKLDQIVVRWVYLRPLLRDRARLQRAYVHLWEGGRFNEAEAAFMRRYLADFSHMDPDAVAPELLLQAAAQLRGYVATYAEDTARFAALEVALADLDATCARGRPACARAYFELVHRFVRWDS